MACVQIGGNCRGRPERLTGLSSFPGEKIFFLQFIIAVFRKKYYNGTHDNGIDNGIESIPWNRKHSMEESIPGRKRI